MFSLSHFVSIIKPSPKERATVSHFSGAVHFHSAGLIPISHLHTTLNFILQKSPMLILHHFAPLLHRPKLPLSIYSPQTKFSEPFSFPIQSYSISRYRTCLWITKASRDQNLQALTEGNEDDFDDGDEDGYSNPSEFRFRERGDERDYDKDPEIADILSSCLNDPEKARSKMEERLRKKRNKILHAKTGSATPMIVKFNEFDFTNSYIWFEFYNTPLAKDITLICNAIRSWHIVGRLGGCNSMNMQLSQSPLDKRPSYDAIQGANVEPSTFFNIGDLEIQDNLARIWVDIGTSEPLLLDVLINALIQISSDYIGIKQVVFGGSEFENWKENLTSEVAGFSVHKI